MLDAAGFLNGPTAIAKLPIAINFNKVNRVRAAMGKFAINIEIIGRPKDGDVVRDKHSRVPIAFHEFFRPVIGGVHIIGLRPCT